VFGGVVLVPLVVLPVEEAGTVTDTVSFEELPDESVARAVMVCVPEEALEASQVNVHEPVPVADCHEPESIFTSTAATALSSDAVPLTFTEPLCELPAAGDWIETFGAVVSATALLTEIISVALATLPAASVARAVSVCEPFDTDELSQVRFQFDVPDAFCQLPLSTWTATAVTPLSSLAVPVIDTAPLTVAPSAGVLIATAGVVVSGALTVNVSAVVD
jgi:hypothetical protein